MDGFKFIHKDSLSESVNKKLFKHKLLLLTFVLSVIAAFVLQTEGACDSLLLSIGNADVCTNGHCSFKELVQTRMEMGKDSSFCFSIDQQQISGIDQVVNFTILNSWVHHGLHNCYFTDDPQILNQAYCACPLSSAVDCQNCPIPVINNSSNICISGTNNGKGCFGGGSGSHCARIGFKGGNRYKVCNIGDSSIEVQYLLYDGSNFMTGTTTINELKTINNANVNVTFYDISFKDDISNDFLVIDTLNPTNIKIIPKDYINSISTRDYTKLGWYRFNETITPKIERFLNLVTVSCSTDQFMFGTSLPFFRDLFETNFEWDFYSRYPGSVVVDSAVPDVQIGDPVYDPPLPVLTQGSYFMTIDDTIVPFGMSGLSPAMETSGDTVAPLRTIYTNNGILTDTFLCSEDYVINQGRHVSNGPTGPVDETVLHNMKFCVSPDFTSWGVCVTKFISGNPSVTSECENPTIPALMWPSMFFAEWGVVANNGVLSFYNTNDTVHVTPIETDSIVMLANNVHSKVDIEFKNITVKFHITNVLPRINNIESDDDYIYVFAQSDTVAGTCLLYTSNDITPTRTIELSIVNNKYKMPILVRKFNGRIIISIQCYKNIESLRFDINIEKGDADIDYNTINSTSIRDFAERKNTWDKTKSAANTIGKWFSFGFSKLFNLTESTIANFFIGIILCVAIFIASIIGLWLLYKVLVWLFCKISGKCKGYYTSAKGYMSRNRKRLPTPMKLH